MINCDFFTFVSIGFGKYLDERKQMNLPTSLLRGNKQPLDLHLGLVHNIPWWPWVFAELTIAFLR